MDSGIGETISESDSNSRTLIVISVRGSVTPLDWAMDSACILNLKSKEKEGEGMKRVRIIMVLSIVLLLFGCSQKQPENVQTTSEKSTNLTVAEEKTVSEQSQIVADTVKVDETTQYDSNRQTAKESTALQTTPKATANYSETETYKYVPSNSSDDVFSYVKKGSMFYIDDKKFSAGQNNYRGITLPKHFLRDGVSLNKIFVNFTYDEKEWLIISSKGVYGYNLAGGETAVMTAPKGTNLSEEEKYCVPSQNDWLKIQIEGFDNENQSLFITDYENHWWANGYIQSDAKSSDEITVKNRIAFKDEAMAELFASELAYKGMKAVQSDQDLKTGCYYVKDEEVYYVF